MPAAARRACALALPLALALACSGAGRDTSAVARPARSAVAPQPVPSDSIAPPPAPPPEPAPAPAVVQAPLELTFVGDIIFGRYRGSGFDAIVGDGERPFDDIAATMRSDLLIGNLETPLVRELPQKSPIGSKFSFGASAAMAQHLVDGKFDALSLANNHAYDQRAEGLTQSPAILRELGIVALGAAEAEPPVFRVVTIERSGWKVGLLAATTRRNAPQFAGTPVVPFLSTVDLDSTLGPVLDEAAAGHDLLIVFIHWGDEYADKPTSYQRREAKKLLARGAHLVVGHHPHVLQGIEQHGAGAVAYSLGNFLFENTNEIPRLTGVLRARFAVGPCLEQLTFHPAYIKRTPSKHPAPATGAMGKRVRGRMQTLSKALGTTLAVDGEDLVLRGSCPPPETPA